MTAPMWWTRNGTKIIGYATAVIGTLGLLDESTVQIVSRLLGPKYGHPFVLICIAAGAIVAHRGHKNTQDIAAEVARQLDALKSQAPTVNQPESKS